MFLMLCWLSELFCPHSVVQEPLLDATQPPPLPLHSSTTFVKLLANNTSHLPIFSFYLCNYSMWFLFLSALFFCLYYNFKSTTPQIQYSEEKWIFYYVLTFGNQITKRKIKLTISISKSDWFSLRLMKADQDEQCITSPCCKMLTLWCSEILSIR